MSVTASTFTSTIHSIIDAALADYTKLTDTDLSKTPFAIALERLSSPEAVLQLLHGREKAFKEYRDDINWELAWQIAGCRGECASHLHGCGLWGGSKKLSWTLSAVVRSGDNGDGRVAALSVHEYRRLACFVQVALTGFITPLDDLLFFGLI